jgi:preprotein translocase subunit SecG
MAAIGVGLAVFIRLVIFQPEQPWYVWLIVAMVGSVVLVLVVNLTLKGLSIARDLHNLKYRDVVTLALFASIAHGFSYTYVIFLIHNYAFDNFMRESMIIVMGGFFGNMLVIGLLTYFAQHSQWLQDQIKRLNKGGA